MVTTCCGLSTADRLVVVSSFLACASACGQRQSCAVGAGGGAPRTGRAPAREPTHSGMLTGTLRQACSPVCWSWPSCFPRRHSRAARGREIAALGSCDRAKARTAVALHLSCALRRVSIWPAAGAVAGRGTLARQKIGIVSSVWACTAAWIGSLGCPCRHHAGSEPQKVHRRAWNATEHKIASGIGDRPASGAHSPHRALHRCCPPGERAPAQATLPGR